MYPAKHDLYKMLIKITDILIFLYTVVSALSPSPSLPCTKVAHARPQTTARKKGGGAPRASEATCLARTAPEFSPLIVYGNSTHARSMRSVYLTKVTGGPLPQEKLAADGRRGRACANNHRCSHSYSILAALLIKCGPTS